MKGFIEITRADNGKKMSIAIAEIKYVEECSNETYIAVWHYGHRRDTFNMGHSAKESYAEVIEKIKQAQ